MNKLLFGLCLLALLSMYAVHCITITTSATALKEIKNVQIGVLRKAEDCTVKSRKGDQLYGSEFDSSYGRNSPFDFTLGRGQVIKGWDIGMSNMCVGEKRKLIIPAEFGYGESGAGAKIPGGATLVFEVELLKINGQGKDEL